MRSHVRKALVCAALTVGTLLTVATPAHAGPAGVRPQGQCTGGWFCGVIRNDSSSNDLLLITANWGKGPNYYLRIGQSSDEIGVRDADGFYVNSGCRALIFTGQADPTYDGPQWVRVHDTGWQLRVRIRC